jgi:hypothetical protein
MSEAQPPPNRMLGSTGWRRHARILIIILGASGLAIVAVVLLNSGPGPKKETLVSATSIPSTYDLHDTQPVAFLPLAQLAAHERRAASASAA